MHNMCAEMHKCIRANVGYVKMSRCRICQKVVVYIGSGVTIGAMKNAKTDGHRRAKGWADSDISLADSGRFS